MSQYLASNRSAHKKLKALMSNAVQSIAAENMVLAAHVRDLGSVWLGTWPQMERVDAQRALFGLPENTIPHSIIALGYPAQAVQPKDEYEEDRVHLEKW